MPQIIDVPGHGRVEFPDGMTDAQIVAAIKQNMKPAAPAANAAPLSRLDKIGRGAIDPIDGGAQLLTNLLPKSVVETGNRVNNWLADKTGLVARLPEGGVDQQVREKEIAYQARRAAAGETGLDGYRILGNIVSPLNLAAASRIPVATSLAGRVGTGIATGAAFGALTPVGEGDFADEKGKQIAMGAAFGGALPVVTNSLGRLISPNATRNPDLRMLKEEGVRPTIGQALGGQWNALEEKLMSMPIVGDAISVARGRAREDFNKAAINRATAPVGVKAAGVGQEGVAKAGDAISAAYNSALGKITGVQLDSQFNTQLNQLRGMAQGLTSEMSGKFDRAVRELVMRKVSQTGSILPDDYKAVDSELGRLAADFGKSTAASERELGAAVLQLQNLLKQQMMRSNPAVAGELRAADAAWANLVRVEGASKAAMNNNGVFTPAQLNAAARAADDSVRKRAVARGDALMQDLGRAGQNVLGNKVPNSGTGERLMYNVGALGSYLVNPAIPASLLAGASLYTSPLQRLLVASASARPALAQPTANALRNASPVLIPAGSQLGAGILEN